MADLVAQLLNAHPIISDQVSRQQLAVILGELERIITTGTDGAVVEFGCYIGTTSLFIRRLLDALDPERPLHVYDSFAGLPPKTREDQSGAGEQFTAGELAVSKKQLVREFQKAHVRPPVIHKGWFSELANVDVPPAIAFAFLDGDFYVSIRDSLRLVLPRLMPGGVIIVDDYAREALPGAAKAVHEHIAPDDVHASYNLGIVRFPAAPYVGPAHK